MESEICIHQTKKEWDMTSQWYRENDPRDEIIKKALSKEYKKSLVEKEE